MVFDLFGTLADEPTSKSIITNQIISAKFNIPYGEFEKYWQDSVIDRLSGSLESTNTYFSVMLSELGITVDSSLIDFAVGARRLFATEVLQPRESATHSISELKRLGFQIGMVSNCGIEIVEAWQNSKFPSLIDHSILSAKVGLIKPDPQIYSLVCERLKINANECLYIGDGGDWELTGAESFGMTAALLQTAYELPEEVSYKLEAITWQGLKIENLGQVTELLQ